MLQLRSGLVKLYNDLLGVDVSVGVLARAVRRWLGLQAASDVPGFWARNAIRCLEIFRIWLLIGSQLHRLDTVTIMLVQPLFPWHMKGTLSTAGSLIFRIPALRRSLEFLRSLFVVTVLAAAWVTASAFPALLAIGFHPENASDPFDPSWFFLLVYLVPVIMVLFQAIVRHDAIRRWDAFKDGVKALLQFALLLSFWSMVVYAIWSPIDAIWPGLSLEIVRLPEDLALAHSTQGYLDRLEYIVALFTDHPGRTYPFLFGFFLTFGVLLLAWLRSQLETFGQSERGPDRPGFMRWFGGRFLSSYNLSRSLLHHYGFERYLSDIFDEGYYGTRPTDHVIEESLRPPTAHTEHRDPAHCYTCSPKSVGDYYSSTKCPPIVVGLGVADLGTSKVGVVPPDMPLVCGLRAATAVVPLLPPVEYHHHTYVDAVNVTAVPMPAMLKLLRTHGLAKGVTAVHAYLVQSTFSASPNLNGKMRRYLLPISST